MLRRMWRISDSNAEIFGEAGIPLKINIILFPQPFFKVSNALSQGAWLRSNIFLCVRIRSLLVNSKTQKKRLMFISRPAPQNVENIGFEPMTSCMPCKRSNQLS